MAGVSYACITCTMFNLCLCHFVNSEDQGNLLEVYNISSVEVLSSCLKTCSAFLQNVAWPLLFREL